MDEECRRRIISEDYANFIIKTETDFETLLKTTDYCTTPIDNIYSVLYAPINTLPPNLFQLLGYELFPTLFGLADIPSLEVSGITKVRNIPNFNLRGQGVIIGIFDTGIEYTHEAFRNPDGTSRILSIWDQTIQTGTAPEGYNYGSEYTRDQINLALASDNPLSIVPSTDEIGHGTMLAGTSAGSTSESHNFSGVAPDADIIVVKLKPAQQYARNFFVISQDAICYEEQDIIIAINYLLDAAKKYSMPISLCFGLGTFQGAHDEYGVISSFCSSLAERRGTSIVIAGGNEGNRGNHYLGSIDRAKGYDVVELKVAPNDPGFSMELWGYAPNTYSIDIQSPTGEYVPRIPARLGETREIRFVFEKTIINVDYSLIESQTGDPLILIRFRNPTEGIWRFRVYAAGDINLSYHIWLPTSDFINKETYFISPNPDTTLTSPGNSYNPIVVTTYSPSTGSIDLHSGRGFTRNNNISPTLSAPGVNMIVPAPNNTYKMATGSSIAAAHTAGIAAMLLEWGIVKGKYKKINSIEIKKILIRGAKRLPNETYPNKAWGYGMLDIYNAFESFRADSQ